MKKNTILKKFLVFFSYVIISIIFVAFNFSDKMIGSWNPQYIYNTNGQSIRDMIFADSLTGYIITWHAYNNDGRILKTTNGGDNWIVSYNSIDSGIFENLNVLNKDTCIACNGYGILRTTNGGNNWNFVNTPVDAFSIFSINLDTIWLGGQTGFSDPHLYLTTNGGLNWALKFQQPSGLQFNVVYFYNRRIGFCCSDNGIFKTTNGGENWFQILSEDRTTKKIQFTDSLTGWKCDNWKEMKKTTNGGYNWITQSLPSGHNIFYSQMFDFSILNKDTIWGCGGNIASPSPIKVSAIIWKTTNGGLNWGYQLPDTNTIKFGRYGKIFFLNKTIGWVYCQDSNSYSRMGGVHTTTGGLDSTIYLGINNSNSSIAIKDYILYQNYPNPFNSKTTIKYKIEKTAFIKIIVFDVSGKEIETLINKKQTRSIYEIKFDGNNLSSGIYLYTLFVDGEIVNTKKLVLIK